MDNWVCGQNPSSDGGICGSDLIGVGLSPPNLPHVPQRKHCQLGIGADGREMAFPTRLGKIDTYQVFIFFGRFV
jgi:hypothetical protein